MWGKDKSTVDVDDGGPKGAPEAPAPKSQNPAGSKKRKKRRHIVDDIPMEHGIILDQDLYGAPIEEVDPFITQETFCVISIKYGIHYIYRFSAAKSCMLWGPMSRVRRFAISTVTHRYFDYFMIGTILLNCVTMALGTNEFGEGGKQIRPQYDVETDILDQVFFIIYCVEVVFKVVARGFLFHKFSYLRSLWNILDLTVVLTGIMNMATDIPVKDEDIQSSNNEQILRICRVMRVLKTVTLLPGLRTMVNSLINSALQLFEALALNFFCLLIFSLFALQFFMGKLQQKCVLLKGGVADTSGSESIETEPYWKQDKLWYEWVNDRSHWAMRNPVYPYAEPMPCGNETSGRRMCPAGYMCIAVGINPDDGWTSFDTMGLSMLSTFQLLTTDFWERPYELVISSAGAMSLVFFVIVLFFGSFYLLNLMLAVVANNYESEKHKSEMIAKTKNQRLFVKRKNSNFSFQRPDRLNLKLLKDYRRETPSDKEERTKKAIRFKETQEAKEVSVFQSIPNDANRKPNSLGDAILGILGRRLSLEGEMARFEGYGSGNSPVEHTNQPVKDKADTAVLINAAYQPKPKPSTDTDLTTDDSDTDEEENLARRMGYGREDSLTYPHTSWMKQRFRRNYRTTAIKLRKILTPIVNSATFEWFITFSIICNTIILALEHHGQSNQLTNVSEVSNDFFMVIFSLECAFKLLAFQKEFFKSWWNVLDLVIVLVSFLDIFLTIKNLSVVRGFRLLRVFKLARSWITMKVLLSIIFTTFNALGNLTLLLGIVIYVFAIYGMAYIGPEYTLDAFGVTTDQFDTFPRWNFQGFGNAFMMVFRIICGEWLEEMHICFKVTKAKGESYKCLLFFIPTLVVGNFVVLNLFLALLLESFNTEDLKKAKEKEMEASGKMQNLKNVVILLMLKKDGNVRRRSNSKPDDGDTDSIVTNQLPPGAVRMDSRSIPQSLARIRFKMAARKVMIKNRVAVAEKRIGETIAAKDNKLDVRRKFSSFGFGLIRDV